MATVYTKTDNYGLNLYGDNDPADLRDGYNHSMRTIDTTLETHLNRIEAVESRETHDEEVVKMLLGDNTVDAATAAKTKWDKASTDVDALTKRVNYLSGLADENIIVIGDSISYGIGASNLTKSWANRLGAYRGATVTNLAKNDAGYLNGPTTFLDQLKSYTGDKDAVTRILIAGGINDKTHVADGTAIDSLLTTAVITLLDYARANFPHAKIQVIPTICGFTPPSLYHAGVLAARDRIITACGMRHVEVLPYAWEWLNGNKDWSSGDDVHPNDSGNELLLRLICEAMDGATVRNSWNGFVAGQDAHGTITNSFFRVEGNTVTCHIQGKAVNNTAAFTNFFQVPAAARSVTNYFIPNSLNKLFYVSYQPNIRACAIGTTTAIADNTEIYLSFTTTLA